jgi:hypothetical protein
VPEQKEIPGCLKLPVIMGGIMASIYILCFFFVLMFSRSGSRKELPKTWEKNMETKVDKVFSWRCEPTTIAAGLLFTMIVIIAKYFTDVGDCTLLKTYAVLFTGLGFSALSAWAWWRISKTFMQFLMDWKTNEDL